MPLDQRHFRAFHAGDGLIFHREFDGGPVTITLFDVEGNVLFALVLPADGWYALFAEMSGRR